MSAGRKIFYDIGNISSGQQVLPLAEVLALVAGERGDGELPLVGELDGDVLGAVVLHVQQQLVLVALANLQISNTFRTNMMPFFCRMGVP